MDREKAIDESKFSFGELREALVERHSEETQQKLERGRVAIAGLGGLGSNVAIALTRIGVGHLHLLDFFVVMKREDCTASTNSFNSGSSNSLLPR